MRLLLFLLKSHPDQKFLGEVSPKFYVMAQYSRHIRKGMQILDTDHSDSVIAYDSVSHKLVIVGVNHNTAQNITYDLSLFSRVGAGIVKRWTTNTHGSDRYVERNDLHINSKSLTVPFSEKTVQTIEINNVFQ